MKILLVVYGVLGLGIRNPLMIIIQNPSSIDKYWNLVPGIRNPRCGIQNSSFQFPDIGRDSGRRGDGRLGLGSYFPFVMNLGLLFKGVMERCFFT